MNATRTIHILTGILATALFAATSEAQQAFGITGDSIGAAFLHSIDTGTGQATAVAQLSANNLRCITANTATGVLYVSSNNRILTLDPSNGQSDLVCAVPGVNYVAALSIDSDTGTAYAVLGHPSSIGSRLVTVDLDTGTPTTLKNNLGFGTVSIAFASDDRQLYLCSFGADTLYSFDPETLAVTNIGPLGDEFGRVQDLCFDPQANALYGADFDGSRSLVEIDRQTGAATVIGEFGISQGPDTVRGIATMARDFEQYGDACGFDIDVAGSAGLGFGYSLQCDPAGPVEPGTAALVLGIAQQSLDLSTLGLSPCTLLTSINAVVPMPFVNGAFRLEIDVPQDPGLAGATFYHQVHRFDAVDAAYELSPGVAVTYR